MAANPEQPEPFDEIRRGAELRPRADTQPAGHRITTQQLLGSGREVIIVHDGKEYRLRVTRQGKLLLTK